MKLINTQLGIVGLKISPDEVMPPHGIIVRELIDGIANEYDFVNKPPLNVATAGQPINFLGGALSRGEERIPIPQISLVPNGDIVMASTTDLADRILDHFVDFLDRHLGYRYKNASQRRIYFSSAVVEFNHSVGERLAAFGKFEEFLNRGRSDPNREFRLKRLSFGFGDPATTNLTLEGLENASDFMIERRAGEPYASNRFYCAAPLKTADLLVALQELEDLF